MTACGTERRLVRFNCVAAIGGTADLFICRFDRRFWPLSYIAGAGLGAQPKHGRQGTRVRRCVHGRAEQGIRARRQP